MKINKIADKVLVLCVNEFISSGKKLFVCENVLELFPDKPSHLVYAAIEKVEDDGFIDIFLADGGPYAFTLNIKGIRNIEENTMLKKGYVLLKEVREWF